ncbi:MAG TPA: InlB B-repeat-containing protein [Sphaerochaeta sp.]|nr:InlB B-repeat-containing protein [Sphaerochaeta sp.]
MILALSVLSLVFVSCEDAVDPPATYAVTFDKEGGSDGTSSVTATANTAMPTATAPTRAGYTFGGYYDAADGGGIQYYSNTMVSVKNWDKTTATTLYAKWTFITFVGPAGGMVFYENPNYIADGWRYLEAAPIALTSTGVVWGVPGSLSTGTAVGTGKTNTDTIATDLTSAAKLCNDTSIDVASVTYNDWFLPSEDELDLLYHHNIITEGLGASYWSSTSFGVLSAMRILFKLSPGTHGSYARSAIAGVWPVRRY